MTEADLDDLFERERDQVRVRWFEAAYASDCDTCGNALMPGERGCYIGGTDTASCEPCGLAVLP